MTDPIELGPTERRKLLRQHRDLRRVLAVIVEATKDSETSSGRRPPLLVALGLRLQGMMERHAAFEEAVLLAHFGQGDPARFDSLIGDHRRQRAELSLLTKLAFGNVRLRRIGLAFRWLARNIVKHMDIEERDLFGGRIVRRRPTDPARRRVATGEYAEKSLLVEEHDGDGADAVDQTGSPAELSTGLKSTR